MKIKDLIKKLSVADPEKKVYIWENNLPYDFTGVGYDDLGDVELYVCSDDIAV